MKKMMFRSLFLLAIIMLPAITKANQKEEKVSLAILPFVLSNASATANKGNVATIQETVAMEFADKSKFNVLDKPKFDKIVQDLKIQSSEDFLNSKIIKQAKQMGARFLVTGLVSEYKMTWSEKTNPKKKKEKIISYLCSLKMSFAIIDVETGKLLFDDPINTTSDDANGSDSLSASRKALSDMHNEVKAQIKNIGDVAAGNTNDAKDNRDEDLKILGVDKADKKGLPETILLNGGGTIIKDGPDAKKIMISVCVPETVAGYKRDKEIGQLKVAKVENEVVICEVKSGAKEIGDGIKAKTAFIVKIIPKK